ncbi:MAG TPA: DUF962 domain-containing protein [Casimicrobiaceae bacterium]
MRRRFASFREFYPYYLAEHADPRCRRMHFVGMSLAVAAVALALASGNAWWLVAAPLAGYGLAWIGHARFERNRPATLRHPLYSLLGDCAMYRDMLLGRIRW